MKFYVPPNLQTNFQDILKSPVASQLTLNFDPEVIINAIVPEIDHREKSATVTKGTKYTYAGIDIDLEIGDYLQDVNGIYLINQLRQQKFPECFKFLLIECNTKFTVNRWESAVYDNDGNVVTAEGDQLIALDIYCSSMVGSSQFQVTAGGVGIIPSDIATVQTRFTDQTKNILIGDTFMWGIEKYEVIGIDESQLDILMQNGLLGFTGKKVVTNAT